MKLICEVCGNEYAANRTPRSGLCFCSKECRHRHYYTTLVCAHCGKTFDRLTTAIKKVTTVHLCGAECHKAYTKEHMAELNRELNPTRMTVSTRQKLRDSRLNTGEGKTYTKTFGRHTHRIVAEQMLGRTLKKGEEVHHIDGNKRNNSPDNLMVFPSHKEHVRHHMKMRYENKST